MVEVKGLNELQHNLVELQTVLDSMNGTIAEIPINPTDPSSVEDAIRQMEATVDRKAAPFGNNKTVAKAAKEHMALLKRFSSAA